MADAIPNICENKSAAQAALLSNGRGPSKKEQLNKLYSLPAPLRTFPLPTFVPHNPISLFHVICVWLAQTLQRPSSHTQPQCYGLFSPETRSVHVTDNRSIRGLWEQGFYGKGSLSRSEPNWLKTEESRRGRDTVITSEALRRKHRAQRQQMKWERARKEREAIEQKRAEEADIPGAEKLLTSSSTNCSTAHGQNFVTEFATSQTQQAEIRAPVGPPEILALPNSVSGTEIQFVCREPLGADLAFRNNGFGGDFMADSPSGQAYEPSVGPLQPLGLLNSHVDGSKSHSGSIELPMPTVEQRLHVFSGIFMNVGRENGAATSHKPVINGFAASTDFNRHIEMVDSPQPQDFYEDGNYEGSIGNRNKPCAAGLGANRVSGSAEGKRKKSVRFSPTVEKNTFIPSEPPSPEKAGSSVLPGTSIPVSETSIADPEHLQLTLEEAFFLSYALGSLTVLDPVTKSAIPNSDMFPLFRQSSYFPPLSKTHLSPDDPFLINYVVYHHFRSLGWVVRGGIKFSVDYMLYIRGPVFTHAEFAVLVLPSYADPYWKSDAFLQVYVQGKEQRRWPWLHCINRVITQVKKTLILVYVDIPKPLDPTQEKELGVDGVLRRYKVREFAIQRWSANRMRD